MIFYEILISFRKMSRVNFKYQKRSALIALILVVYINMNYRLNILIGFWGEVLTKFDHKLTFIHETHSDIMKKYLLKLFFNS